MTIFFKFAKKFDSKYFTCTITQISEGNVEDITKEVVYNDGVEENISLLQIYALKKSKYVENTTFNESTQCGNIGFHFRKTFKNHGFFIGFISEILSKKKLNRRVVYCDGEVENLILKSIQTLSRLYSLLPSYPIREDFPEILIVKIPMMSNNINCISQIVHSFRNII